MQDNARYLIVEIRNQWLIKYNDEEYGPYLTQAEAILFAVDAAQKLVSRGENAGVYFMTRNCSRLRSGLSRSIRRRRPLLIPSW